MTSLIKYRGYLLARDERACAYRYLKCLRFCEYFYNNRNIYLLKLLYYICRLRLSRMGRKYGIKIPLNVCGYGVRIMHLSGGGGILLNAKSIGNYCGFNAGVFIGNIDIQDNTPTIGDRVAFGPGAKAFGKIVIGDNCFIASNAVVTKDIPDNSVVGGVPAKIIKKKE
ncbi:MAG: serine acetyltransferase [Bacteroidaceae bacterium]|nr:serine acetyltransferase [Bacteroidaceae bacterium]